jgi:uncharacterized glyoxalase superfamily protein PhnB
MTNWGVIPSIRFKDLPAAVAFYTDSLGFELTRGTVEEGNIAVTRGDARLMLESSAAFYNPAYNAAIASRLGTPSANSLYMEAKDLEVLYDKVTSTAGAAIVDPLADRDWGQSEFTVADPEGNWLTFWKASGE